MFIISQYLLHKSKLCSSDNISTYSIAIGLIIYSTIYLYLLYYSNDLLFIFNKFIIFIIAIDLLLSMFYHFNNENISKLNNIKDDLNLEDELLIENNNKIQEHLDISDDELTEDFDENLDEEIQDNESENLLEEIDETADDEILNQELQNSYLEEIHDQEIPTQELQNSYLEEIHEQETSTQEIQNNHLEGIINNNIDDEIIIDQPKPKAKRQTKKKNSKVDQIL
jgi:hypothetical protein